MKQFNLEEYLVNPSRKVITRDGRPVKIHCTNFASDQPIIATMGDEEYSYSFSKDGRFMRGMYKSCHDLFFVPEKHERWMNVYRDRDMKITNSEVKLYTSQEEAEKVGETNSYYITTEKNKWEE